MNYKVLNGVFLLIGCALSSEVYAVCKPSGTFNTVDINMNVGRVVVKASDQVGTVLRTSSFPIIPNNSSITCTTNGGTFQAALSEELLSRPQGDFVYDTNIAGIGIRLSVKAGAGSVFSGTYPYSKNLSIKEYKLDEGFFIVEIIKTAASTGSGVLTAGRYSRYYSPDDVSKPLLTSTVYGSAITIASSSCELVEGSSKLVQLPIVNKSGFQGVGSTQGEQAFDLNLLCNGAEKPISHQGSDSISLNFDYTAAPNTTNVLSNNSPTSTRAQGVGVQLKTNYNKQSKIIVKNEKLKLGDLMSNQNIRYNVPLSASYYQTDSVVTPGEVSSIATVTIEYE